MRPVLLNEPIEDLRMSIEPSKIENSLKISIKLPKIDEVVLPVYNK